MKKVWIFNHYAGTPSITTALRHYNFAKYLIEDGYQVTVFAASAIHNTNINLINEDQLYFEDDSECVPFVYIRTRSYRSNGVNRILNMFDFYNGLFRVTKNFENPDIIIASSVHPLTLLAGQKIAKKLGIPCICEIRDLWPESFVAYDLIKKDNVLLRLLYAGEEHIYKKANGLIFTMQGAIEYIKEHKWDVHSGGKIDLSKVYHINNGVDLQIFDYNKENFQIEDEDLLNQNTFKVVYTGSVRLVNRVDILLDVAKLLKDSNIKFLIWGDGDQLSLLKKRVLDEEISNVCFKGKVEKKYIPYITSKAQLNIIFGENMPLFKFGISMNKLFDYFAGEKPVLTTFKMGYSLIEQYRAGLELDDNQATKIAESILYFKNLNENEYMLYCNNSRKAAIDYSFKNLTNSLETIIEHTLINN